MSRVRTLVVPVIAALAAAGIGFAGGMAASSDPTTSAEYKALQDDLDMALADVDRFDARGDDLGEKVKELTWALNDEKAARKKALGTIPAREKAIKDGNADLKKRKANLDARAKDIAAREKELDFIESNTIGEGTWTVGSDIKAGTYRSDGEIEVGCYWEITAAGSNGSNIIENDISGGGHPTVTLSPGQVFKSQDCGTWAPVG